MKIEVREIQLTHGHVTVVDAEDYAELAQHKWYADKSGYTWYAKRLTRQADGREVKVSIHRLLLPDASIVDHINGDGLDNRRANLRPATVLDNCRNARLRSDNTSGFKGVSFFRNSGRWRAVIQAAGQTSYLGHFEDAIQAAHAYDAAARELHGEFACVNFPLPGERAAS